MTTLSKRTGRGAARQPAVSRWQKIVIFTVSLLLAIALDRAAGHLLIQHEFQRITTAMRRGGAVPHITEPFLSFLVFDYDHELLWRYRPQLDVFISEYDRSGTPRRWELQTNAAGFREREIGTASVDGLRRIVFLGDSRTAGVGVKASETYARRTEQLLNVPATAGPWQTINAGVDGYTSWHGVRLIDDLLAYNPDLVMCALGTNDYTRSRETLDEAADGLSRPEVVLRNWAGRSALYFFMYKYLLHGYTSQVSLFHLLTSDKQQVRLVPPAQFGHNLQLMQQKCRTAGCGFVYLMIPELDAHGDSLTLPPEYLAQLKALRDNSGLPVLDVSPAFAQNDGWDYLYDGWHPDPRGHELIAREAARYVRAHYPAGNEHRG